MLGNSSAVHVLYRDVLGVKDIDYQQKLITIQFSDLDLTHCSGEIPLEEGILQLKWDRSGDTVSYQLGAPADYQVQILDSPELKITKDL